LSEDLFQLLVNADANLTRQNFISATERAKVNLGVYAPVDYPDAPAPFTGHFGGTAAWSQRVNCSQTEPDQNQPGEWDTVGNSYLKLY
jgi:hypothetical protein